MEITQFDTMTQDEIIAEAKRRGYKIHDARSCKAIGGSKVTSGADEWMNAANVRLWKLQTGQAE